MLYTKRWSTQLIVNDEELYSCSNTLTGKDFFKLACGQLEGMAVFLVDLLMKTGVLDMVCIIS